MGELKFIPAGQNIFVKQTQEDSIRESGLVISDGIEVTRNDGTIIALGEFAGLKHPKMPMTLNIGDRVKYIANQCGKVEELEGVVSINQTAIVYFIREE